METLVNHTIPSTISAKMFVEQMLSSFTTVSKTQKRTKTVANKSEKPITIFLVDDDPMYLKALELSISSNSDLLKIHTFQTGEACLQNMKLKPAIVILDYYLNSQIKYAWNGIDILNK